jgi:hypothetical protein
MRDFKLIDQADMIVSYVPELPGGTARGSPRASSASSSTPSSTPRRSTWSGSPEAAEPVHHRDETKVFTSTDEALAYFEEQGMFAEKNLFGQ